MSKLNNNTHLTAKKRDKLSYPAKILLNKNLLKGEVLDFGCGFGTDVDFIRSKGISIDAYDKYYFPDYPQKKYDTIICLYVLNVLQPLDQSIVLIQLSQLIKPTGKVYFAVRRDVKYEGFRTHKIYQEKTYQCNVTLNYKSIFENDFCEIYEYQHYNRVENRIIASCLFCDADISRELLAESATVYSVYDKYPVSRGHSLIIAKRHCSSFFELSFREQTACLLMVNEVKKIINARYSPDGFNIGINVGKDAGQTVDHVHIHLIPRYNGDVGDPSGGIRCVIPNLQKY